MAAIRGGDVDPRLRGDRVEGFSARQCPHVVHDEHVEMLKPRRWSGNLREPLEEA